MKAAFWLFTTAVLTISFATQKAVAQCSVSYQPSFSVYTNASTSDGSDIYAEVVIDGSGYMTQSGACSGLPTIVHTSYTDTSLNGSDSGWVSGGGYCADCYISDSNAQDVLGTPGIDYEFDWDVQVSCNVGGTFFTEGGADYIRLADAFWTGKFPIGSACLYTQLACSPGTTPTCPSGFGAFPSCPDYVRARTLVHNGVCQYPSVVDAASGPDKCN
jgi:hypothetical protein